jgi:hypothetical protein
LKVQPFNRSVAWKSAAEKNRGYAGNPALKRPKAGRRARKTRKPPGADS